MLRRLSFVAVAGLAVTVGFLAAIDGPSDAHAKGKKDEHLRYAKTYAEAIAQAKARNAHVFVTFHKDK